jgi:hypothetical protein
MSQPGDELPGAALAAHEKQLAEIRSGGRLVAGVGLVALAVAFVLRWLAPADAYMVQEGFVGLTAAGTLGLWIGIGMIVYPSPEAVRQEPLEGSMIKTFKAMPRFWQVWWFLGLVLPFGAAALAIIFG